MGNRASVRRAERSGRSGTAFPAALLAAAVSIACSGDPAPPERTDPPVRLWEPGALVWRFPTPEGPILEDALSFRVTPGGVFVLDPMAGRVLHLSLDGDLRATIGRPGIGPGELRGPVGLQVGVEGDIWVGAPGQTRLSRFRPDGEVLREYRTPYPVANFVVAGGRPLAPSLRLDRLLDELTPDGDTIALAPGPSGVPARLRREVVERVHFQGALMASSGPGTVFLLQNGHGEDFSLWRIDLRPGERRLASVEPVPLPGWLYGVMAADVEELRRELSEEFAQGAFMIPFKNLHAGPGRRLTLVPTPSHVVLALNLWAGRDTVDVIVPSVAEEHRGLVDAVPGEDRLYALYPTEVRAYALRRRGTSPGEPIPEPAAGAATAWRPRALPATGPPRPLSMSVRCRSPAGTGWQGSSCGEGS